MEFLDEQGVQLRVFIGGGQVTQQAINVLRGERVLQYEAVDQNHPFKLNQHTVGLFERLRQIGDDTFSG